MLVQWRQSGWISSLLPIGKLRFNYRSKRRHDPIRMLTLYHCVSACSFRVFWMLEELVLPYELRMLTVPPRAHDKSFLELNPRGTVPLFIDGETRMTDPAAICEYLALLRSPGALNVAADEPDFGDYLHMSDATLTFPQTLVLR